MIDEKKIVLMTRDTFAEPFRKNGYDVFSALPMVYSLFYEGKDRISIERSAFKERLDFYKDKIFEFNPTYFLVDQWFFFNLFGRLDNIGKNEMVKLWLDFINDLNKAGIVSMIFCQDDPLPFMMDKAIAVLTHKFQIVLTHSLQMSAEYKKHRQEVIYFPGFVVFDSIKNLQKDDNSDIDAAAFKFDIFFIGNMCWQRRIFFWRLSKRIKDLDYFFGSSKFFFSSRKDLGFDISNKSYVKEIYKRSSINLIYGSLVDSIFHKTWGITTRVFDIAYCHGFFLCDYRKHLTDLFDIDTKLYSFKTLEECYKMIRFYLENTDSRKELADRFHKEILEHYTVDKVIQRLINYIEKAKERFLGKNK